MIGWHLIPGHGFHFPGASWVVWRFTDGLFSHVEYSGAVVDDFGNLVRVQ